MHIPDSLKTIHMSIFTSNPINPPSGGFFMQKKGKGEIFHGVALLKLLDFFRA